MKIKICGTRDKNNLIELLALKPDYLGFIFYPPSPRYVSEVPAIDWPSETEKVGVFVNEHPEKIKEVCSKFSLNVLQLHGDETPVYCETLKNDGFKIIKAFNVHDDFDFLKLEPYKAVVDYFLFDASGENRGGNGVTFNWEILKQYDQQLPYFLSGGIGPWHAEVVKSDWLAEIAPFALDLNSKFEISPALKDIQLLEGFLQKIK